MFCVECGKELKEEFKFCHYCGCKQVQEPSLEPPIQNIGISDSLITDSIVAGTYQKIEAINIAGMSEEQFTILSQQMGLILDKLNIPDPSLEDRVGPGMSDIEKLVAGTVSKKFDEAQKKFKKPVGDPENLLKLGNFEYEIKNYGKAIEYYDKVLEINPKDDVAWNNKAISLNALGRNEEAVLSYEISLEINPNSGVTWYNKGSVLSKHGRVQEAIHCFDKALDIDSLNDSAWNNKGLALNELGENKVAMVCYDAALEINPNDDMVWNNKGTELYALGRISEARQCFDKALEINPKNEIAIENRREVK